MKGIALVLSLWGFVSYLYGESAQKMAEARRSGDLDSPTCYSLMA